jgi:LDH2 family malate/lactate/ureidoglycolate dehydrogenase
MCNYLVSGGYKGYGLAMLVEIFCGILAGSDYGPHVRRWKSTEKVANLVCIVT